MFWPFAESEAVVGEAAHAALRPTLGGRSAEGSLHTFYFSSAVDQSRHPDGLVVARLRQRGNAGDEGLAFVEYSAAVLDQEGEEILPALIPVGVLTDPKLMRAANPGCRSGSRSSSYTTRHARSMQPRSQRST
jgi:hypothetical protein